LLVLIPSAFVSISSGTMSRLPATGRLRIASAGAYHNVLIFAIVSLVGRTTFGNRMLAVGYEDVSRLGKVVISIDDDSPLNGHLIPGETITRLDDFALGSDLHQDLWSRYFLEPDTISASPLTGWCVETEWLQGQPSDCCSTNATDTSDIACFSSFLRSSASVDRCIDPMPIMAGNDRARCSPSGACAANFTCVIYASPNPLLRIEASKDETPRIVLWSGPPLEVWEQVEVGELRPRVFVYPLWLPKLLASYISYLKTIMFSLFVMNLLPLSFLDGGQVSQATIDFLLKDSEKTQDIEVGGRGFRGPDGGGRMRRSKSLIRGSAEVGTWVLIGASSALGLVHLCRP